MGSRWAAVVALVGFTGLAVVASSQLGSAESPFGDANAEPAPFNPQMSALMNMLIQPRHAKLGLAGRAENWPLAAYARNRQRPHHYEPGCISVGLRDRALIGVMVYTFARVNAVLQMKVHDYFVQGRRGTAAIISAENNPGLLHVGYNHHALGPFSSGPAGSLCRTPSSCRQAHPPRHRAGLLL